MQGGARRIRQKYKIGNTMGRSGLRRIGGIEGEIPPRRDYLGIGRTGEVVRPWNKKIPEATTAILRDRGTTPWKSYVEKMKIAKTKMFGVDGAYEALKADNTEDLTWKEVFPLQMQQSEENFYNPEKFQMTPFQPTAQERIKQASVFQMMLSVIKKQHTAEGMETIIKMAEYENSENEARTGRKVYEDADEIATKFCERNIYKLRPKAEPPKRRGKNLWFAHKQYKWWRKRM